MRGCDSLAERYSPLSAPIPLRGLTRCLLFRPQLTRTNDAVGGWGKPVRPESNGNPCEAWQDHYLKFINLPAVETVI
jgi:hypothetical protein